VFLFRRELLQVAGVAPLRELSFALQVVVELGQAARDITAARLAQHEEVPKIGQQSAVVRRDQGTAWKTAQPIAQPGESDFVEVLRRLVEQYDFGAGRPCLEQRRLALLAMT
jgi:hypothetical protein